MTKTWLNLVKASVSTKMFLYCLLMGQLSRNQYTTGPGDYWQPANPVVYVDLCNDPYPPNTNGIGDIFSYIMVHGTPIKSFSHYCQILVQSLMTIVIMQHNEAWLHDILRGVLIGVSLHHWWYKFDGEHPVLRLNNKTAANTSMLLYT